MPSSRDTKIPRPRHDQGDAMVVKRQRDVEAAAAAAQRVVDVHFAIVEFLAAGQTLAQVDAFVGETLESMDCRSAFLRYRIPGHPPFPSHSCLSPNTCVVHGTHLMTDAPLVPGDILSVDIGVSYKGWIGDAAWTYGIEAVDEATQRLMTAGRECLRLGLDAMQPGRPLLDWARAVEGHVTDAGFSLVRGLGGHGYGRRLHGPPFISNVVPRQPGEWPDAFRTFEPGLLVAVEPMINAGDAAITSTSGDWPIHTTDGSLSVHYEADVLVTEHGRDVLTGSMFDLPDIVGR
ncbi:MAG: M24 family metallopeptidase [Phycisphaerales bacterium]|nr:M24 family metallopeptidase [Phycisphaerales bacterium]